MSESNTKSPRLDYDGTTSDPQGNDSTKDGSLTPKKMLRKLTHIKGRRQSSATNSANNSPRTPRPTPLNPDESSLQSLNDTTSDETSKQSKPKKSKKRKDKKDKKTTIEKDVTEKLSSQDDDNNNENMYYHPKPTDDENILISHDHDKYREDDEDDIRPRNERILVNQQHRENLLKKIASLPPIPKIQYISHYPNNNNNNNNNKNNKLDDDDDEDIFADSKPNVNNSMTGYLTPEMKQQRKIMIDAYATATQLKSLEAKYNQLALRVRTMDNHYVTYKKVNTEIEDSYNESFLVYLCCCGYTS